MGRLGAIIRESVGRKKKEPEPEMTFFGSPFGGNESVTLQAPGSKSAKRETLESVLLEIPSPAVRDVVSRALYLAIEIAKDEK